MSKSIANDAWLEFFKAVAFDEPHDGKESHSEANKSICGDSSESPLPSEETVIV
ncbi:hypothetical protein KXX16_002473 [Aspergillus fumigatus]|uniref:Uncharacterized protein n=1 Tax=Aspergillus fumigatus TaxID=746128 RepID=A0A9P8NAR4_ASPFM